MNSFWSVPGGAQRNAAEGLLNKRGSSPGGSSRGVDVEEQLDKLTLICWAMWTLIQEETKLTEADLLQRVKQLDMLDGDPDGKASRQVASCPSCGRTMSPRHRRCLYCGYEQLNQSAFDDIT